MPNNTLRAQRPEQADVPADGMHTRDVHAGIGEQTGASFAQPRRYPIVMMTGEAFKAALLSKMEASAADLMVKPFTRESLTSKLLSVLSR